jgi:hypothetical protein
MKIMNPEGNNKYKKKKKKYFFKYKIYNFQRIEALLMIFGKNFKKINFLIQLNFFLFENKFYSMNFNLIISSLICTSLNGQKLPILVKK